MAMTGIDQCCGQSLMSPTILTIGRPAFEAMSCSKLFGGNRPFGGRREATCLQNGSHCYLIDRELRKCNANLIANYNSMKDANELLNENDCIYTKGQTLKWADSQQWMRLWLQPMTLSSICCHIDHTLPFGANDWWSIKDHVRMSSLATDIMAIGRTPI